MSDCASKRARPICQQDNPSRLARLIVVASICGNQGSAGPGGATVQKPVGMVCFAWASRNENEDGLARSHTQHFAGDREAVRQQSIAVALQGVLDLLREDGIAGV